MRVPPFFRRLFKFTSMDFETVRVPVATNVNCSEGLTITIGRLGNDPSHHRTQESLPQHLLPCTFLPCPIFPYPHANECFRNVGPISLCLRLTASTDPSSQKPKTPTTAPIPPSPISPPSFSCSPVLPGASPTRLALSPRYRLRSFSSLATSLGPVYSLAHSCTSSWVVCLGSGSRGSLDRRREEETRAWSLGIVLMWVAVF
jgi:hypothetical protein